MQAFHLDIYVMLCDSDTVACHWKCEGEAGTARHFAMSHADAGCQ